MNDIGFIGDDFDSIDYKVFENFTWIPSADAVLSKVKEFFSDGSINPNGKALHLELYKKINNWFPIMESITYDGHLMIISLKMYIAIKIGIPDNVIMSSCWCEDEQIMKVKANRLA